MEKYITNPQKIIDRDGKSLILRNRYKHYKKFLTKTCGQHFHKVSIYSRDICIQE
jgi:hypothetical protein